MSTNHLSSLSTEIGTDNLKEMVQPNKSVNTHQIQPKISDPQALSGSTLTEDKITLDSININAKASTATTDNPNKVGDETELSPNDEEDAKVPLLQSLEKLAKASNQLTPLQNTKLEFIISYESDRTVVKLIDTDNDSVIRQIPSEEFIKMADKISDLSEKMNAAQGLLFESTV